MSANTTLDERPAAMAGWNAVTGARGIAAPLLMSALVQTRVVDLAGGLVICAAVTATGTWLYLRLAGEDGRPAYAGVASTVRDRLERARLLPATR